MTTNKQSTNSISSTELDRGMPDLSGRNRQKTRVNSLFIWLGVLAALIIMVLAAIVFINRYQKIKLETTPEIQTKETANTGFKKDLAKEQMEIMQQQTPFEVPKDAMNTPLNSDQAIPLASNNNVEQQLTSIPSAPPGPSAAELIKQRKFSGNVLIRGEGKSGAVVAQNQRDTRTYASGDLADRFSSTRLINGVATIRDDRTFLLPKGTIIPCALRTKIITNYPGMILCNVTKDVYSADGRVLLIERGSTAVGEQRSAVLQGASMIFAQWSSVETPKGVVVQLDSPATNALGATGIDAYVDTHWWLRFGNAIMLSLIGDTTASIAAKNSGGNIQFSNTQATTESMASEALKNNINIPPTGYTNQGALVNIFVARDVDFRTVYKLAAAAE